MSVYSTDPDTGLPREPAVPENELRVRVLAQLRTYNRNVTAKELAAGMGGKVDANAVLHELAGLEHDGLAGYELRSPKGGIHQHWRITDAGREVLHGH